MSGAGIRRLSTSLLIVLVCLLGYQNCGQSFKTVSVDQSLTQSCKLLVQSSISQLKSMMGTYDCDAIAEYRCELRQFSPTLDPGERTEPICIGNVCVPTDIRQFSTAATQSVEGVDPKEFESGGEFNRQEARCHNKVRVRGVAAFEATGPDVASALKATVAKCRQSFSEASP